MGASLVAIGLVSGCGSGTKIDFAAESGLRLEGPAGRAHVGGRLGVDARALDSRQTRDDRIRVEPAELHVEARTAVGIDLQLTADLVGVDTRHGLREAWAAYEIDPRFRLTTGYLRSSIGIEGSIPPEELPFVSSGFASYFDTRSDFGVRVDGQWADGRFGYELAALAGEGSDLSGERRGDARGSLRLVSYPLRPVDSIASGLFVSLGGAYSPSYEGHFEVPHPYRSPLLQLGRIEGDSSDVLTMGWGWDAGRIRLTHEWVTESIRGVDLPGGGSRSFSDQILSWVATLSWRVFGGEDYDSRPYIQNRRELGWPRGSFGLGDDDDAGETADATARADTSALEIAARYANADIDRDFFVAGLTNSSISSQEFRTFTGAVIYSPFVNLRLSAEVTRTIASQRPAIFEGDTNRDTSFVFRAEWRF